MQSQLEHPKRVLALSSGRNVRDLGGYLTTDGRTTRFGRFVRSADMDALTEEDRQRLLDYGVTAVFDLRMSREADLAPNVFTGDPRVRFEHHDFWGTRFDDYRSARRDAPSAHKLADLYCAGLEASGFIMRDIFASVADGADDACVIYHCRSGKDRTGLVSALLLAIAGVPEATICEDYALTRRHLPPEETDDSVRESGAFLRGCAAETMARTLGFIDRRYGGAPAYLEQQGVSREQVQRIFERFVSGVS